MRVRRSFTTIACLFALACQPSTHPVQPIPSSDKPSTLSQRCTNTAHGFSVSYPAGWYTNDKTVLPACSVFDSSPIDLPHQSEIPFELAVVIGVDATPFDRNPASSQWERVLSVERLTIQGAEALRMEVEATGEGLADRGMRTLRYAVDLGNRRTLTASTHNANSSYEENKRVLARMMDTIELR